MDWRKYNDELVMRGEYLIRLSFLDNWHQELSEMNRSKSGRPYKYPDSFFRWLAPLKIFLDYRALEGFVSGLSKYVPQLEVADYTTIWRRLNSLDYDLPRVETLKDFIAAYDTTGIKVTSRGEWIRHKWKIRRGWIKVAVTYGFTPGEDEKHIIGIELSTEETPDDDLLHETFRHMDDRHIKNMDSLLADGAMYTNKTFDLLNRYGIDPGIKIRKNASTLSRGSPARAKAVREFKDLGYDKWREVKKYGLRWHVEGLFSAVKRKFGESVRAIKHENMLREARMKFIVYENMKIYGKSRAN